MFWSFFIKYFLSSRSLKEPSSIFAIISVAIGSAVLFLTLTFMNSYAATIKFKAISFLGHGLLMPVGSTTLSQEKHWPELNKQLKELSPFLHVKAVLSGNHKLRGIVLEGVSMVDPILDLKSQIIDGTFSLDPSELLLGKEIAKSLGVQVGDSLKAILFLNSDVGQGKVQSFQISGIVDFGQYSYNSRYALTQIEHLREVLRLNQEAQSGYRFLLNSEQAVDTFQTETPLQYHTVRSWKDVVGQIFQVVEYEKKVLLALLFLLILMAAFNLTISLFVATLKKASDMSLIRTLGGSRQFIFALFALYAVVLGAMGIALGGGISYFFIWILFLLQNRYGLLPEDIYELSQLLVYWDFGEVLLIILAISLVCFVSSIYPVRRFLKRKIVEGLSVE